MMTSVVLYFSKGGFVMWPLFLGCLIMWYGIGYRYVLLCTKQGVEMLGSAQIGSSGGCSREAEADRYRVLLRSIVMVLPLLGLLGTVTGMIETFDTLNELTSSHKASGISEGVSTALFTTQFALVAAVPGFFLAKLLERRQEKLLLSLIDRSLTP